MPSKRPARIYFTDFFDVSPKVLADYGAFNVACIVDLPLFIDPFLLFTSSKPEYQALHAEIIRYLSFLRDKSVEGEGSSQTLIACEKCRKPIWVTIAVKNGKIETIKPIPG